MIEDVWDKRSLTHDVNCPSGKVFYCTCIVQVPSYRAEPLTPACDTWCEFPVSDRPNAVMQFFQAAQKDPAMIKVGGTPTGLPCSAPRPVRALR